MEWQPGERNALFCFHRPYKGQRERVGDLTQGYYCLKKALTGPWSKNSWKYWKQQHFTGEEENVTPQAPFWAQYSVLKDKTKLQEVLIGTV